MNSITGTRSEKPASLNGKTAVITGASSGVGRATALELARQGVNLVLTARRGEALEELAAICRESGVRAIAIPADVTDAAAIRQVAGAADRFGGRIDIWFNNAAVLAAGAFTQTPVEVHDRVIQTNLMGYIHGAHAVLPYFIQQQQGILINNISVGGWFPTPFAMGYTASKYGLRGFSETLRAELHSWPDIHVCDLFPAFLDTPGMHHAANYTNRALRPAPPVYDPLLVARAVVSLAQCPEKAKTVGSAATFLRLSHSLWPALTRRITVFVMETYFKRARPAAITSGNLFQPVGSGSGIYGGWRRSTGKKRAITASVLIAAAVAGFFLTRRPQK